MVQPGKSYELNEALSLLQTLPRVKFPESIDISINLSIDPRKSDQNIRGFIVLPHGTGKIKRVAVFTTATHADAAKAAGADIVGLEDLVAAVKEGQINFDSVIATPDAMRIVGQIGQILGPRGLMPNPKDGTVTTDVAQAVANAKAGQVRYRNDKAGVVHACVGKIDFSTNALAENILAFLSVVKKAKPASSKGIYFKKVTLSSTMGPGLQLDLSSVVF